MTSIPQKSVKCHPPIINYLHVKYESCFVGRYQVTTKRMTDKQTDIMYGCPFINNYSHLEYESWTLKTFHALTLAFGPWNLYVLIISYLSIKYERCLLKTFQLIMSQYKKHNKVRDWRFIVTLTFELMTPFVSSYNDKPSL